MYKNRLTIITIALILGLASWPTYAYLDPGTGSIILQAIIASIAFGLATMRMWWYRIKAFFSGKSLDNEDDDITEGDNE